MRILIVQNEYALSGAPLCAFEVAKFLKESGHEVFTVAPGGGEMVKMYQDIGISPSAHPQIFADSRVSFELAKQVDQVIVFTSVAFQAVFGAKGAGKPVTFAIHEFNQLGVHMARDNILFRQALNIADHVTFTCEYAVRQFKPYLTHNRVTKAIVGLDVINTSSFPKKQGEKFKLITVGSIEQRKNQLGAAIAMKGLNAELTIIGRPLDANYTQQVVNAAKDAKNVAVMSPVAQGEILKLMNTHDAVLCTSFDETIPRFVMEGLALGKPVIASEITGIPEVISDKETGRLFNVNSVQQLKDIITELSKDSEQVERLGKAARKSIADKFNLESYTSIYKRLLEVK